MWARASKEGERASQQKVSRCGGPGQEAISMFKALTVGCWRSGCGDWAEARAPDVVARSSLLSLPIYAFEL